MIDPVTPEPASPCTGVCVIGADGTCEGCLRTLGEIAGWSLATIAEKRDTLAAVAGRRATRMRSRA